MNEEYKYWIAMVSAAGWVYSRHRNKPFFERLLIVAVSMGFGVGVGQEVADWAGMAIIIPSVAVSVAIWIVLDIGASVLSDREGFKKAFWKRIGGD